VPEPVEEADGTLKSLGMRCFVLVARGGHLARRAFSVRQATRRAGPYTQAGRIGAGAAGPGSLARTGLRPGNGRSGTIVRAVVPPGGGVECGRMH
jgi:hypothetical protein